MLLKSVVRSHSLACKAIVDELSYEVKKVDPKKTIQVKIISPSVQHDCSLICFVSRVYGRPSEAYYAVVFHRLGTSEWTRKASSPLSPRGD